jgi:diacylglycerol kinase
MSTFAFARMRSFKHAIDGGRHIALREPNARIHLTAAAAAAVLVAAVAAVVIGVLILGPPLWQKLHGI